MKIRKLVSVLIVLAMVLALAPAAFAENTTTVLWSGEAAAGGNWWDWVLTASVDGSVLTEGGYLCVYHDVQYPGLNVILGGDSNGWAQINSVEASACDSGYVTVIGYDALTAAYGADLADVNSVTVYVSTGDTVTVTCITYTAPAEGSEESDGAGETEETAAVYIVAGVSDLCGSNWDPADPANQMADGDGDGIYTITYSAVAPGNYEFKVVENLPDGTRNWLCNDGWNNEVLSVSETCDVTISYDTATGVITVSGSGLTTEVYTVCYIVAGESALCGSEWDASDTANQMTDEDGDGIYTIVYTNVAAGWPQFKVVENLSNGTKNWLTGNSDGSNMWVETQEGDTVTITYNAATGEITVTAEAPAEETDPTEETEATTEPKPVYTAYLCYGDADWWPSCGTDYPPVTCEVSGDGNYTLIWDVANTCWQTAEGMSVFYIDIMGAYAGLKNNVVTNVTVLVDGEAIDVNMGNVKVYNADGAYRIELYNMYGGSAGAVASDLIINETMTVVFTLGTGNATTGDSTNLMMLCGILVASMMGITALVVARKKFI